MKHIYYKTMKRTLRSDFSITYAGGRYIPENTSLFLDSEINFVDVEISIEKRGNEPGTFELGRLFYRPTRTEAVFLGVRPNTYIPFIFKGEK